MYNISLVTNRDVVWGGTLAHACHPKKRKEAKKECNIFIPYCLFFLLNMPFFNYVYLVLEKLNEILNTN